MRKFKRSTQNILMFIFLVVNVLYVLKVCQVEYEANKLFVGELTIKSEELLLQWLIIIIIIAVMIISVPPDFKYNINISNIENGYIIFEMSEYDFRRINKSFEISSKNYYYIVLFDGISRIRIAYNKEVLKFLNEIEN